MTLIILVISKIFLYDTDYISDVILFLHYMKLYFEILYLYDIICMHDLGAV